MECSRDCGHDAESFGSLSLTMVSLDGPSVRMRSEMDISVGCEGQRTGLGEGEGEVKE